MELLDLSESKPFDLEEYLDYYSGELRDFETTLDENRDILSGFDFYRSHIHYDVDGKNIRATYKNDIVRKNESENTKISGNAIIDLKFSKDGDSICVDGYMKIYFDRRGEWFHFVDIEPIVLFETTINKRFTCMRSFDDIYNNLSKGKLVELEKKVNKLKREKSEALSKREEIEERLSTIDAEILKAEKEFESYKISMEADSIDKGESRKLKSNKKQA